MRWGRCEGLGVMWGGGEVGRVRRVRWGGCER